MDGLILFEVTAILVAWCVSRKAKIREGYLLLSFFCCTAITSFILNGTEAYHLWTTAFVFVSVVFGLLSLSHVVVIGYIGYIVMAALDNVYGVNGYELYIYSIFGMQLMAVRYGHNFSWYWDRLFDKAPVKNSRVQKKAA